MPLPPNPISYTTFAIATPCANTIYQGDAATVCPDVFTVTGTMLANLVQGTNVVAVEVHNIAGGTTTQDILFGSALFVNKPSSVAPRLFINSEGGQSTLYWNGEGFTLQQASDFSATNIWSDVIGPVTQSPFSTPNLDTMFYRLRN
jgi:hypothetical protein